MQVFKAFFKIAKKRLSAALIYFVIYAAISVLLSVTAESSYSDHFKASALTICVIDEDASSASEALVRYLGTRHHITAIGNDKEAVLDRIYYRTLNYALTIPAGFEEALLSGNANGLLISTVIPESNSSHYVNQQISEYLTSLELYLSGGYDLEAAIAAVDKSVEALPAVETVSFHGSNDSADSMVFYYFQYLPYVFIAILFSGLAPILITLNEKERKARTICSSLSPRRRIAEMSAGCLLYSLGIWALFLLLCFVFYHDRILLKTMPLLAIANSFCSMLFSTALTLLISCFGFDDNVLNMAANIIGLSMAFLCGVFVPQSILSTSVLQVARFLPAYWYIRANNMLAGFGSEIFDVAVYLQCIGIQLLYAAAVFAITFVIARQIRHRS